MLEGVPEGEALDVGLAVGEAVAEGVLVGVKLSVALCVGVGGQGPWPRQTAVNAGSNRCPLQPTRPPANVTR